MEINLTDNWRSRLERELNAEYFKKLEHFVDYEYTNGEVFPPQHEIFNAFNLTPFDSVKVIILGQDPYHDNGQAHGLSFSVPEGVKPPPSLVNIFKELKGEYNIEEPQNGSLIRWAEQGVLLLNSTLTVRAHEAGSHRKRGWELFSDRVIELLSNNRRSLVFMLWGSNAQKKEQLINKNKHLILKSVHPSPLSAYRGFIGNNHFISCNNYLQQNGIEPIKW